MVSVTTLWLPVLLSAILCFFMSSLIHMVFKWHAKDFKRLPHEGQALKGLRDAGVTEGSYAFPFPGDGESWNSPEMLESHRQGPSGFLEVLPLGPPQMGKSLGLWLIYLLLVGTGVAWILSLSLTRGTEYKTVFQTVAVASALAYVAAQIVPSIWRAQPWRATLIHMLDGVLYALLTAGSFAWLWPR